MVSGPSLRVSWICLLLISGGVCFPAKRDSRYRYGVTGGSNGGSDPGLPRQYGPAAAYQQPGAAPQHAGSPTGNQSPSRPGTPIVASDGSPSYELNRFIVSPESSAPEAPSRGGGYVDTDPSPPASGTGKMTRSFSEMPQSDAATSEDSNIGSGGPAAFSPVLVPPSFYAAAENEQPTLDFGDGPVPYIGAPEAFKYGSRSNPFGDGFPEMEGGNAGAADGLDDALADEDFGDRPASFPDRPLVAQPAEGGASSVRDPTDKAGLHAAPATSSFGDGSGSPLGRSLGTRPGPGYSFSKPEGGAYAVPARFSLGGGSGSPPGRPLATRPAPGPESSFYNPTGALLPYAALAPYSLGGGSGSPAGQPVEAQPAVGVDTSFFDPTYWMPPPPDHHSKLIQSRNGYRHASVSSSHTRYSPFYPRPSPEVKG